MSNRPSEKRYWGIDGEYHMPPDPNAKGHNVRPSGYVPPATPEDAKELEDAIRECEEAAKKRKEK